MAYKNRRQERDGFVHYDVASTNYVRFEEDLCGALCLQLITQALLLPPKWYMSSNKYKLYYVNGYRAS